MASGNSMAALMISVAALAVVVWALGVSERSHDIYGHSVPDSYVAQSARR